MHHETRQILQVRVTRHSTAEWAAQPIVDACGWDRDHPRYRIHDRDGRCGIEFDDALRADIGSISPARDYPRVVRERLPRSPNQDQVGVPERNVP